MLVNALAMLRRQFRAWRLDTAGVVAMVVVFCLPAFVAAAGVALDLAQAYNIKTRLSAALDKAALAAGNTTGTPDEIEDRINAFIVANYPDLALGDAYDLTISTPSGVVDISAKSRVRTVFMGIFGQEYINVFAETIVKKEVSGLELVMVMDTTGSMAYSAGGTQSKIEAAKEAANTLINILYGEASNVPKLYVGVVPFSMNVNIDPQYASWTTSDSYNWGPAGWAGCVEARQASGRDVTLDTPTVAKFPKYYYPCGSGNKWYWSVIDTELVTNGSFSTGSNWWMGGAWSISGGKLVKSTVNNIVSNGDFSSTVGWTLGTGWTVASGVLSKPAVYVQQNGDFSSTSNWSLTGGWTISSGKLSKTTTTTSAAASEAASPAIVAYTDYEFKYTITSHTGSKNVHSFLGNKNGTSQRGNGTITEVLSSTSNTNSMGLATSDGFKGTIDSVSVRRLDYSSVYRTPSTALVSGAQYDVTYTVTGVTAGSVSATVGGATGTARDSTGTYTETITAGSGSTVGFTTTDGFNGTIDNLIITPSEAGPLQFISMNSSYDYLISYDITAYSAGSVKAYVGGAVGNSNGGVGTYQETINAGSTNSYVGLYTDDGFIGQIDNFSVKRVTSCGSGPTYYYEANLDSTLGPNKYCSKPILEMTASKSAVQSSVNALTAQGGTMIPLGMVWAYRMLDPSWLGWWNHSMQAATTPGPLPLSYNYSGMNKAVILMTDGDNQASYYGAYGSSSSNVTYPSTCSYGSSADAKMDCKTRDLCESMKSQNILIYTIALGTDLAQSSKDMLKACATSPAYYFYAPSSDDLKGTFTTIANQLNSLYIVY